MKDILTAIYKADKVKLRSASAKDLNQQDDDKRSPLMHAVSAENADPEVIRILASRGADVNAKDSSGWTALHFAAQDQKALVVRALLENGAEVDVRENDGTTPLWRCMMSNASADVVRILLEAGADPTAQDKWGSSSPLSLATDTGDEELEKLMLKHKKKS